MTLDQPKAPDAIFARRRWIPHQRADYARECHTLLLEHGAVEGTQVYPSRHRARWRAQYLIGLLVELDLAQRWELSEHTGRRNGGWIWSVEYIPRRRHG